VIENKMMLKMMNECEKLDNNKLPCPAKKVKNWK
jgi:hypothetical protein